ncbi:signal transduction histidine kinase [Catenulispora sp. GP43]|uniref:sensor histidine kinase n=1 Tax=Catenulispora sp. GP43 TaxID=3156263 RepID=UPI003519D0D0
MRTQPSVPGQRAWVVFDVVSAAALCGLTIFQNLENWHRHDWAADGYGVPSTGSLLFVLSGVVLSGAAVAVRRRWPLGAAAVVFGAWLVMLAVDWPMATRGLVSFELIGTVLLYSVAVTEPLPIAVVTLVLYVVGDSATVAGMRRPLMNLVFTSLALIIAWVLGVGVARYRDIGARLREQQDAAARAELDRERVRLARELHDVLAHSMSVVNVQAGYGRFAIGRDPAAAEAALAAIQQISREAMAEMRGMLAVLREGGEAAALAPAPRVADVPRLVATCAEAGVSVRIQTRGTERELPDGIDLAAYRIVQEALTNVVKHAHTRSAQVLLEYQDTELIVQVTDAGRGGPAPGSHPGGGHGLAGITERVGLYDGTVAAGPLPGGGWRVRAVLPCPRHTGDHTGSPDSGPDSGPDSPDRAQGPDGQALPSSAGARG